MPNAIIYDAVRTPRGKGRPPRGERPGGALSQVPPQDLVSGLIQALDDRNPGLKAHIQRLSLGCVGQVGTQGGHIAHVSKLVSGLPDATAVKTINNFCVSGLTACFDAVMWAQSDRRALSLAGGVECLSQVDFLSDGASYYTDTDLMKAMRWAPPIMGAELIASLDGFTKTDLDDVTLRSHQRAARAWSKGHYDQSVVPVIGRDGELLLEQDELIRADLTSDKLAAMRPAFAKQGAQGFDDMMLAAFPELDEISHLHSIANCPGMADGAALVVIGGEDAGSVTNLKPMAKVIGFAEIGDDPVLQLTAGLRAMDKVLADTGLGIDDMDRIEFMEAFAAVPLKFERDYKPDMNRVNVNGGHLAMGHPMGATGGVLLTNLVHELHRCDGQFGLVVAQAGGGIGTAIIIERL